MLNGHETAHPIPGEALRRLDVPSHDPERQHTERPVAAHSNNLLRCTNCKLHNKASIRWLDLTPTRLLNKKTQPKSTKRRDPQEKILSFSSGGTPESR